MTRFRRTLAPLPAVLAFRACMLRTEVGKSRGCWNWNLHKCFIANSEQRKSQYVQGTNADLGSWFASERLPLQLQIHCEMVEVFRICILWYIVIRGDSGSCNLSSFQAIWKNALWEYENITLKCWNTAEKNLQSILHRMVELLRYFGMVSGFFSIGTSLISHEPTILSIRIALSCYSSRLSPRTQIPSFDMFSFYLQLKSKRQ